MMCKENESIHFKLLKQQMGMSLMEILIALTLIGIAGTFVVGKILDSLEEGRVESAKIQIRNISERLKDYKRKCGTYPTTEQGLDALIEKPTGGKECPRYPAEGFIDGGKIPLDPWDTEFIYESDGRKFTIISLGSDREEGGEGFEQDLNSNDL